MPYPSYNALDAFTPDQAIQLQQFAAYLIGYLLKEHKDDGSHSDIHADSVTGAGDVEAGGDGLFGGDMIAEYGSGTETGMGVLSSVNGSTLLAGAPSRHGVLIGGASTGYFLTKQAKGGAFGGGGTYMLALWDLEQGTTAPALQFALDTGEYTLIDGGTGSATMRLGNANRPILEVYSTNGYYEHGRSLPLGEWTAVSYSAGNFTASAGTWGVANVDQLVYRYAMVGKTMIVNFEIANTDVSNAGVTLRLAIPGGFTCAAETQQFVRAKDNGGAYVVGLAIVAAGATYIEFFATVAAGTFALTAADNTDVFGCVTFEVQ